MILRTFYNHVGSVTRVVYELPRHEEVHKDTKMRLIEKNGHWFVVAEIARPLKSEVTSALAEDEYRVIHVREMDGPVARD
jgi:hypothetical protein